MDVILTGPPRSGTTLVCHLLNRLPQCVALHEPMRLVGLRGVAAHGEVAETVARFFAEMRGSLLTEGRAISKHVAGRVPDNPMSGKSGGGRRSLRRFLIHLPRRLAGGRRLRRSRAVQGVIQVDKPLEPDFLLALKHCGSFTAPLSSLNQRFPCFAIIRNPLSVLGSWNSIEFAPGRGRDFAAERLDPTLTRRLRSIRNRSERQLALLDWYYRRYMTLLPAERIVRYEKIVATGGRTLSVITPRATALNEPLENHNANPLYDRRLMRDLGARLLASDGAYWNFHERSEVTTLLAELTDG